MALAFCWSWRLLPSALARLFERVWERGRGEGPAYSWFRSMKIVLSAHVAPKQYIILSAHMSVKRYKNTSFSACGSFPSVKIILSAPASSRHYKYSTFSAGELQTLQMELFSAWTPCRSSQLSFVCSKPWLPCIDLPHAAEVYKSESRPTRDV